MNKKIINLLEKRRKLSPEAFDEYVQRLVDVTYPVFKSCRPNITRDMFLDLVRFRNGTLLANTIQLMMDETKNGQVFGFVRFQVEPVDLEEGKFAVMDAGAYVLEAYRGQRSVTSFAFFQTLEYFIKNSFSGRQNFAIGICSPSSYHMGVQLFPVIYPNPNGYFPPATAKLYDVLKERLNLPRVSGRPFILPDDSKLWAKKENIRAIQYWEETKDPAIRYYMDLCGDYLDGADLFTLIPVNAWGAIHAAYVILKRWFAESPINKHELKVDKKNIIDQSLIAKNLTLSEQTSLKHRNLNPSDPSFHENKYFLSNLFEQMKNTLGFEVLKLQESLFESSYVIDASGLRYRMIGNGVFHEDVQVVKFFSELGVDLFRTISEAGGRSREMKLLLSTSVDTDEIKSAVEQLTVGLQKHLRMTAYMNSRWYKESSKVLQGFQDSGALSSNNQLYLPKPKL